MRLTGWYRLLVFVATTGVAMAAGAGAAHAKKTVKSPFPAQDAKKDKHVFGLVGEKASDGTQYVVWYLEQGFDTPISTCKLSKLGDFRGLNDDYDVVATSGSDVLVAVHAARDISSFCPQVGILQPTTFNGHRINLKGDKGDDAVYNSIDDADVWAYGGPGKDTVRSHNRNGSLFGDDGNDYVRFIPIRITNVNLRGGNGDDCLEDHSYSAWVFDCGPGRDVTIDGYFPVNAKSCEGDAHICQSNL